MIERQLLIDKLNAVAPGLADNDLLPQLTHFAFTGTHVLTFSEKIGMSTPLKTEFKGLVPGKILLDLLSVSTHATRGIDISPSGTAGVRVRAGKTDVKLAMLPLDQITSVFKMPSFKTEDDLVGDGDNFFTAVEDCLHAVSNHAVAVDQLGVTMMTDTKGIDLYATDKKTIVHSRLPVDNKAPSRRLILNTAFCEQMLKLRGAESRKLALGPNYSLFKGGDVTLFGKLLESDKPLDFSAAIKNHMPKNVDTSMVDIPERLTVALQVIARIGDIKGAEAKTKMSVRSGKCSFSVASVRGEASDEVALKGHPDASADVYASTLLAGCERYDRILFGKTCAVMTRTGDGPQSTYMVANCGV